jgi:hypothetical protein
MQYRIINSCSNGGQLVPAYLHNTPDPWPLDRLLKYVQDEAWLWRQELYRGCKVRLDIYDETSATEPQVSYEVTATYTKGLCWRAMEIPRCAHDWQEGVDEEGELAEPAYDVCINCGERRD